MRGWTGTKGGERKGAGGGKKGARGGTDDWEGNSNPKKIGNYF